LNKKVTAVVCVYNTEEYLARCLESIVNQTLRDIEIIIINDGSTDNGIDIIRRFEEEDKRIIVFDIENHGVSHARNMGLLNATGDYIIFVDSDDYLEHNMLNDMYNEVIHTNSDMAVCNFRRVFNERRETKFLSMPEEKVIEVFDDYSELVSDIIGGKVILGRCVWNKLYNTGFLRKTGVIFEERSKIFAEDAFFNFKTLKYVKKICIIDEALYNYYQRSTSVSQTYKVDLIGRYTNFINELENYYADVNLNQAFSALSYSFLIEILFNKIYHRKGLRLFKEAIKNRFFREKTKGIDLSTLSINQIIIYLIYRLKMYHLAYFLFYLSNREGITLCFWQFSKIF
jgi:glycosyltransferase involved in cell wall biosynthesis